MGNSLKQEKNLSICIVGPLLGKNSGWVVSQGEILAQGLRKEGYLVFLTSSKVNRFFRLLDMIKSLIRWHRKIKIVILMVFSDLAFIWARIITWMVKRLRKPLILRLHGGNLPSFSFRHLSEVKRVFKRADNLMAPSYYLASFCEELGFKCEIIPNIIFIEKYPFRKREKIRPFLLWMRTFHYLYHPEMAIEVLEGLIKIYPEAKLTMAGQDKGLLGTIKKLVELKGLSAKVRFVGFLEGVSKEREFNQHDIFLNTSRIDNMPLSLIEAAAFGLPIVSTNVGGIPYIFKHKETAMLRGRDDAKGIVEAIDTLIKDDNLVAFISTNARRLVEGYDWSVVKPKWEKVFKDLTHET